MKTPNLNENVALTSLGVSNWINAPTLTYATISEDLPATESDS